MEHSYTAAGRAEMGSLVRKSAKSAEANCVPIGLGLRVPGLGTQLDENKRRTRDLG